MRVMVSLAAWNDLAWFVASSKHIKTLRSNNDQSHTVFNRVVFSLYVKLDSLGWQIFSGFAYLAWKTKATYVDANYSEGKCNNSLSDRIDSWKIAMCTKKNIFVVMLESLIGVPLTPLIDFWASFLLPQVSTARPLMVYFEMSFLCQPW